MRPQTRLKKDERKNLHFKEKERTGKQAIKWLSLSLSLYFPSFGEEEDESSAPLAAAAARASAASDSRCSGLIALTCSSVRSPPRSPEDPRFSKESESA